MMDDVGRVIEAEQSPFSLEMHLLLVIYDCKMRKLSAPLFCSSGRAFRLSVQSAHGWRKKSSNPGEDTCDPRKANNYVGSAGQSHLNKLINKKKGARDDTRGQMPF
jgi:hypothetical protein